MKLEDFRPNTEYAFTLAPDDHLQFWGKGPARMDFCIKNMIKKCKNFFPYFADLWVVPEYSFNGDSTKCSAPRLHWHGVIIVHDMDYFLEQGYYQLTQHYTFVIKPFDEKEGKTGWVTKYCTKQRDILGPMCAKRGLPYRIRTKQRPPLNTKVLVGDSDSDSDPEL